MDILYFVAIGIICFVVGLLGKNLLPEYFSEKGKNLATKEDIQEITELSESVKSLVSYNEKHLSRIKEKETEVLLEFFEKCVFLDEKLMFNFGDLTYSENNYPIEYEKEVNKLFAEIRISYQRLFLYLSFDNELDIKINKIVGKCEELRNIFRQNFGKYKVALVKKGKALAEASFEEAKKQSLETHRIEKDYYSSIKPIREEFRINLSEFIISLNKHFKNVKESSK